MSTKDFTIRNYYKREIAVDDGVDGDSVEAGATFPVRVRRFSVAQLQEFQRGFARMQNPTADRFIYRKADGDEQAFLADGQTYAVPHAEIERRRIAEMQPEAKAEYERARVEDDSFNATFCAEAISQHLWLPPGVTIRVVGEDDTEKVVTTGAGLVEAFGGNYSTLIRLVGVIYEENVLSPKQKKVLRLLSGLTASSPTPAAAGAVDGVTPAATVAPVETAGSVSNVDASAAPDPIRSGLGELAAPSSS